MADPDDLLDGDGDLNDISYDLDCAEEDALLADDNDSFTYKSMVTTRHVTFSDNGDLTGDEDAIELGVEDDLQVPEDTVEESVEPSYSVIESARGSSYQPMEDSDEDEENRKKERSRFTNERNMAVPSRTTTSSSIPDSLDKVPVVNVKPPISTSNLKSRMRTKGLAIRPVRPLNIHINPHFKPGPPHPPPGHHPPGPPRWEGNYHSSGFQGQPFSGQYPHGGPMRGRVPPPQVWNVPPQGYNPEPPHFQQPYQEPYYGGGGHVPPHLGPHHGPPHPGGPHHGGPPHPGGPSPYHGPHDSTYFPDHGYHPGPPQGNWGPQGFQGCQQPFHPGGPPQGPPHRGFGGGLPPQGYPRGPPRPPHQFQPHPPQPHMQHPNPQGSNLRSRLGPPVKREAPVINNPQPAPEVPPSDDSSINNLVVSVNPSNLQIASSTHHFRRLNNWRLRKLIHPSLLPLRRQQELEEAKNLKLRRELIHSRKMELKKLQRQKDLELVESKLRQAQELNQQQPKNLFPGAEEEELNAYMKKIEEQKIKREMMLKEKEQKRVTVAACRTTTGSEETADALQAGATKELEMKLVRVKTKDGNIVVKRLPLERISKMKKLNPDGGELAIDGSKKTVLINNLSASTSDQQIMAMAKQVGPVASIELNQDAKSAKVKFIEAKSAHNFIAKFQRRMVDLSMINLSLLAE